MRVSVIYRVVQKGHAQTAPVDPSDHDESELYRNWQSRRSFTDNKLARKIVLDD